MAMPKGYHAKGPRSPLTRRQKVTILISLFILIMSLVIIANGLAGVHTAQVRVDKANSELQQARQAFKDAANSVGSSSEGR